MMRRILVGAAIAGCVLGFATAPASASDDIGPNSVNTGQAILSQLSVIGDLSVANDTLNDSIKYINILSLINQQNVDNDGATSTSSTSTSTRGTRTYRR